MEINVQVAFEGGTITSYALCDIGQLFLLPNIEVCKGQIVGIYQHPSDLSLNVYKKKTSTNVRPNKEVSGENYPRL